MGFREWFSADPVMALFYIVAIPATVILILQTIMLLFGLGHGADGDMDVDTSGLDGHLDIGGHTDLGGHDAPAEFHDDVEGMHGDTGLRLLTVRGLVAFFAVGGWSGIASVELGASRFIAVIAAMLMGTAALILVALFFKWAVSLQYNGTLRISNAVGKTGEVYLTVPAKNGGRGKINVIVQERLTELEAVTNGDRALRYGERVKIVGMTDGNTVIVEAE